MKHMKRLTAFFLAVILALGLALPTGAVVTADPQGPDGEPWDLNEYPVIMIHGIGQSEVYRYDENDELMFGSDGRPIQGWPPKIGTDTLLPLIPKLIFPLLASLILQHDIFLTKVLREVVPNILDVFLMKPDGRPLLNMQVERWHRYDGPDEDPTSLAELDPEVRKRPYGHLPLQDMSELIDETNVYYFAYDSFGNLRDIVDELYVLINDILEKHETEKVNLIPISLGGTIMNGLAEWYPDLWNVAEPKLNNIVYAIAALDGSDLVGDLYTYKFALDNQSLYRKMIPGLLDDGYLGFLINIVLRLLPKRLVKSIVDAVIDGVVGGVVGRSTMIWALLPSGYYPTASALWLEDPSMALIKPQVAAYHEAQLNSRENITNMRAKGVKCYAIAEYNFPMYNFVQAARLPDSCALSSSDGLLQLDSPSMGAKSWGIDVVKPGYNPELGLKYMCPYGFVDASDCTLRDYTWFFKDQDHERTGRCDVIMRLVLRLACGADDPDIEDMPEWPQFNYGRDGRWFAQHATNAAKGVLELEGKTARVKYSDLTDAQKTEFDEAYEDIRDAVFRTIVDPKEDQKAKDRFTAIMEEIGAWDPPGQAPLWERALDKVAWFFSEALYFGYGPRGFIDPIWRIWCD